MYVCVRVREREEPCETMMCIFVCCVEEEKKYCTPKKTKATNKRKKQKVKTLR